MIHELGTQLVPVLAITCTFMLLVVWVIAATADSIFKTASNRRLKERLIDRGASALEIDRIIKAGEDLAHVEPVPPVKSYTMSNPTN